MPEGATLGSGVFENVLGCQISYLGGGRAGVFDRNMVKRPVPFRAVCEDTEGATDCRETVGFNITERASDEGVIRIVSSESDAAWVVFGASLCESEGV